jgi:hypothetical protein
MGLIQHNLKDRSGIAIAYPRGLPGTTPVLASDQSFGITLAEVLTITNPVRVD